MRYCSSPLSLSGSLSLSLSPAGSGVEAVSAAARVVSFGHVGEELGVCVDEGVQEAHGSLQRVKKAEGGREEVTEILIKTRVYLRAFVPASA